MNSTYRTLCLFGVLAATLPCVASIFPTNSSPYAQWSRGPSPDPAFFPLAVWLQDPANAERYRQAGINTYIALWEGCTEDKLARLKRAGMKLICEQDQVALRHLDDPTIIGWMHGDEPDNAQSLSGNRGYGPPITPAKIIESYRRIRAADPSRPVMINLGQGVAWDGWYGRGVRSNHPEDYPQYLDGCDLVSFDVYPVVHDHPDVAGKLWYVAKGVERLVQWSEGKKVVWDCLECTHISNPKRKPTPHEVRAEAWMSLIHGSRGLIYFAHQFKPSFREPALLDDAEMLQAVTALNHQIVALAPVLNLPQSKVQSPKSKVVETDNPSVPVAAMVREWNGATYVFAVGMRAGSATAAFAVPGVPDGAKAEVIDEDRSIAVSKGAFKDAFGPWEVHLYRLATR